MAATKENKLRYFLTYSGVRLPLNLVNSLSPDAVQNRNTYFTASFDDLDRMVSCRKIVYGEIEFEHRYAYHADGSLQRAEITEEDETRVIEFPEQDGTVTRSILV